MTQRTLITLLAGLLLGCSSSETPNTQSLINQKDVAGLRAKQAELVKQNNAIKMELNTVIEAIDALDENKKRSLVTVLSLKKEFFQHTVILQGTVKTDQNLMLSAEFLGKVKAIHVKEGQTVKKGDLLLSIDDGGLSQNVALLKTQRDLAKTIYLRQKRLWDQNIGSEIEYLQAKAAFESQENSYEQLKKQLDKASLYAPFSGRIDDIVAEVGQLVTPGINPLLRLVNLQSMYIEVDVPERYFTAIEKGTTATIEIPSFKHSYKSRVTHKGTHISPGNRTFKTTLAADSYVTLAPNTITIVKLVDYQKPDALVIPLEVVSENFEGTQYVYVVTESSKAEKRFIKTGLVEGDVVEVISGLKPEDRVIDEGARLVKEDENVRITNAL
ncbi:efflux RND transporter periplasmic adaptor subunit [Flavobacteriaceae bacterium]|jgi:RND family efflux transporter MFP subunit|nr:efflux RND transporter periplasmic adaptor subunit [Flavobacteriaceae bacterium]MDG1724044.1 efflux RND transporter periplasmic adaptor subunit [Flavobacteriaceae bacterium]MDG2289875.1 efflux RND transporter periplasmic adaptor subunit [Flavobacteriaceae bacterium]